ncbi:hypothetical protein NSS79_29075 [Paenibacillus sp. FSL L8-0436]|uniref:hypothetical protein n=1 Tax=Paenibacillus sp. FSL L8-0436 TaxID=2954686 RepID=UPI003158DB00
MKNKFFLLLTTVVLALSLTGTSFASESPLSDKAISGLSYNSIDNNFSIGSELEDVKIIKSDTHLSLNYFLEGKRVAIEADYSSNDDFQNYEGEATINDLSSYKASMITNEYGLSGLVYDSTKNLNHGFVIDYKGIVSSKKNELSEILNNTGETELTLLEVPKSDMISPMTTSTDYVIHHSYKPAEGVGVRSGFNEGWVYYTRYTNDPDGIKIYFNKMVASIETFGMSIAGMGIKNEDAMYTILFTTYQPTQQQQTYPIQVTSTSSKPYYFYSQNITKAMIPGTPIPVFGFSTSEIMLP